MNVVVICLEPQNVFAAGGKKCAGHEEAVDLLIFLEEEKRRRETRPPAGAEFSCYGERRCTRYWKKYCGDRAGVPTTTMSLI